jgi:hypothetical protein
MPLDPVFQTPPSLTVDPFIPHFDPSDFTAEAFGDDADEEEVSKEYYVSRVSPLTCCLCQQAN